LSVRTIDVIELEPEVIAANRRISDLRAVDPLADPRITVALNDARNGLRLTDKRYNLIVSQPSHPWTAGASHLFTREFLELAQAHLNDGGALVQWMSTSFVDASLLKSLAATLTDTFAHVRLYQAAGSVLYFLASDAPLDIERQILTTGGPINANALYFGNMGLGGVDDFAAALVLDESGVHEFASGAPASTDNRNRMATDSYARADGLAPNELMRLLAPLDPLLDPASFVHRELAPALEFGYIAARLLVQGQLERANALAATVSDASTRALIRGLIAERNGAAEIARAELETALRADPANDDARFALLRRQLTDLARGNAAEETLALARPLGSSATAVVRGWDLALAGDFRALAALDNQLAAARVTNSWFPEAQRLRADWRIRIAGDTRYARDAVRIIDRALVVRADAELLLLRAEAAGVLNDDDAIVGTVHYALQQIGDELRGVETGNYPLFSAELLRLRIAAWRGVLASATLDAARREPLARELERLDRRVEGP
jgi:hypothetical protein